jgi:hypothetical protein
MQCRSGSKAQQQTYYLWRDAASAVDGRGREKKGKGAMPCSPRLMMLAFDQRASCVTNCCVAHFKGLHFLLRISITSHVTPLIPFISDEAEQKYTAGDTAGHFFYGVHVYFSLIRRSRVLNGLDVGSYFGASKFI